MTTETAVRELPLMVGMTGLAGLLDLDFAVKLTTYQDARLPPCDKFCDNRPLWFTANVVEFGERNGNLRVPRESVTFPEPQDVACQADIAEFFRVPVETVRQRWRAKYTNAIKHERPVPAAALYAEDFNIEGVVLWTWPTVKRWGVDTGKLNKDFTLRERIGNRWIDPDGPAPAAPYVDPVQPRIDSGELMTYATIARRCGVKEKTVKAWHKSGNWETEFKLGKDFPAADGPTMDSEHPTWKAETIETWLNESHRDGENKAGHPHGTGQRERREPRWHPATVLSWATDKGKRWRPDADLVSADGSGWNRDDIARIFGVTPETARQWIYQRQHGFPDPDLGDPIRRKVAA